MNTLALKALAAASLSILAVAPAAADDHSVTVNYGDLDIATAAGAEKLNFRLLAGIEQACARPDMRDLKAMAAYTLCKDAAMSQALSQLARQTSVRS